MVEDKRPSYTTRVVVEIDIDSFNTPEQAVYAVLHRIDPSSPSIKKIQILGVTTNFHANDVPGQYLHPIDITPGMMPQKNR
jgi:hypothetical protein